MLSKKFIEEREFVVSGVALPYKRLVHEVMTAAYLRGMAEGISRHSVPATIKISWPQEEWRVLLGRAGEILEEMRRLFGLYDAGEPILGRFFHAIFAAERLGPRIAKALAPVSNVLDQDLESGDPPEGSRLWRCERELKKARAALERTWCDAADWLQHTFPGTAVMAHGMRSKARADAGDRFTGWDDLADSSPSTIAAVMGAPIPPEPAPGRKQGG